LLILPTVSVDEAVAGIADAREASATLALDHKRSISAREQDSALRGAGVFDSHAAVAFFERSIRVAADAAIPLDAAARTGTLLRDGVASVDASNERASIRRAMQGVRVVAASRVDGRDRNDDRGVVGIDALEAIGRAAAGEDVRDREEDDCMDAHARILVRPRRPSNLDELRREDDRRGQEEVESWT
jgi:hypothetical protein